MNEVTAKAMNEVTAKAMNEVTAKATTVATDTPAPTPIDERAVSLANQSEAALAASAKAEGAIAASQKLSIYAAAGNAHLETIRCFKASIDYSCEHRGVATTWTTAEYESAVDQITVRVRASNPELFTDFDALKEKPSSPSKNRERIHTRLKVGVVYSQLVAICGDKIGSIPYRTVANYLVSERVLQFSKADVGGSIRKEHVEFLKKQFDMLADGKLSSASFLNALQQHFNDLDQEAVNKANANMTPAELLLRTTAAAEGLAAKTKQEHTNKVREHLASYLAKSCTGLLEPKEIAEMITGAAKKADIKLPLGNSDVKSLTAAKLSAYLEDVIRNGGNSPEERKALKMVIVRLGSMLAAANRTRQEKKAQANGKHDLVGATV